MVVKILTTDLRALVSSGLYPATALPASAPVLAFLVGEVNSRPVRASEVWSDKVGGRLMVVAVDASMLWTSSCGLWLYAQLLSSRKAAAMVLTDVGGRVLQEGENRLRLNSWELPCCLNSSKLLWRDAADAVRDD